MGPGEPAALPPPGLDTAHPSPDPSRASQALLRCPSYPQLALRPDFLPFFPLPWQQWAATRADLFPPDMCSRLQRLQADAPAHDFWFTRREVENAFNITLEELFETFEELPVASGSIAQVHRAILRPGFALPRKPRPFLLELFAPPDKGTLEVAVKVRHPRVADIIARDFAILQFWADLAGAQRLQGPSALRPQHAREDTYTPPQRCQPQALRL